jgi:hypothetical protein
MKRRQHHASLTPAVIAFALAPAWSDGRFRGGNERREYGNAHAGAWPEDAATPNPAGFLTKLPGNQFTFVTASSPVSNSKTGIDVRAGKPPHRRKWR